MNAGTCWGKNTIGPRGRSVEKAPGSDFTFFTFRPRNRWQDEVMEDGRIVGGKRMEGKKGIQHTGKEEAPENGKETLHSAYADGMKMNQ
jgi:hypothetical protein